MFDFEIMNTSLKTSSTKRITEYNDEACKAVPEFEATDYGGLS